MISQHCTTMDSKMLSRIENALKNHENQRKLFILNKFPESFCRYITFFKFFSLNITVCTLQLFGFLVVLYISFGSPFDDAPAV